MPTSRALAVNVTVGAETYPAGSVPPRDVAAQITNPKAWGADVDDSQPESPAPVAPAKKTTAKKTVASS